MNRKTNKRVKVALLVSVLLTLVNIGSTPATADNEEACEQIMNIVDMHAEDIPEFLAQCAITPEEPECEGGWASSETCCLKAKNDRTGAEYKLLCVTMELRVFGDSLDKCGVTNADLLSAMESAGARCVGIDVGSIATTGTQLAGELQNTAGQRCFWAIRDGGCDTGPLERTYELRREGAVCITRSVTAETYTVPFSVPAKAFGGWDCPE